MTQNNLSQLAEMSRVETLTLARNGEELNLRLCLREEKSAVVVRYLFTSVSDLRFRGERTELNELVLLLVEDVSANGWEGVRFAVKDYEEEFISFRCAGIERLSEIGYDDVT